MIFCVGQNSDWSIYHEKQRNFGNKLSDVIFGVILCSYQKSRIFTELKPSTVFLIIFQVSTDADQCSVKEINIQVEKLYKNYLERYKLHHVCFEYMILEHPSYNTCLNISSFQFCFMF